MPSSFSHIALCLVTLPLPLLQLLQNCYCYFCYHYRYFHTTLLLNTLLHILSYPGVVELTTQLLILENILWLPLCRIYKFGMNTLPSKTIAIPYTCGLSTWSTWCMFWWWTCGFRDLGNLCIGVGTRFHLDSPVETLGHSLKFFLLVE